MTNVIKLRLQNQISILTNGIEVFFYQKIVDMNKNMCESGPCRGYLSNELLDMFDYSADTATSSAFIQQRNKIKPEAFETIFKSFSTNISLETNDDELRILAVDVSDIQIATNPDDKDSYIPS